MMAKIYLVPVDFSKSSEAALDRAVKMAREEHAELLVIHAISTAFMFPLGVGFSEIFATLQADARKNMDRLVRRKGLRRSRSLLLQGLNAADVIVATAKKHHAAMIIMGSHGKTGFERFALGSAAERTVRTAECPVLIVKNTRTSESKTLLVPFDFSKGAKTALKHALRVARAHNNRLAIVHIVPPVFNMAVLAGAIRGELEATLRRLKATNYQLYVFERPEAGRAIANVARRLKASMIIMGSTGRSGFNRLLLGSVAERTLRYAECPVLIIK